MYVYANMYASRRRNHHVVVVHWYIIIFVVFTSFDSQRHKSVLFSVFMD